MSQRYFPPVPKTVRPKIGQDVILWFVSLICGGGISLPVLYLLIVNGLPRNTEPLLYVALFFAVGAGLLFLGYSIYRLVGWFRFGWVPLHLDHSPVMPGDTLAGWLEIEIPIDRQTAIEFQLICKLVRWTRNPKGETSKGDIPIRVIKWRELGTPAGKYHRVEFNREIPEDLPPTDMPGKLGAPGKKVLNRDYHEWELQISKDVSGVDLERSYEILVQPEPEPHRSSLG